MHVQEVISTLQARGVSLQVEGGNLNVQGSSRLTAEEKALLRTHKAAFLKALEPANDPPPQYQPTDPPVDGQPFSQKELAAIKQGHAVRVWSGVLEDWLYWVRDEERKAKAVAKGIEPWRLWTLAELTAVQGMNSQDLRNLHTLKHQFNGTLNPGEPPARWRAALEPLQPAVVEVSS